VEVFYPYSCGGDHFVVGRGNDCHVAASMQVRQQLDNLAARFEVEVAGGLVAQEDVGAMEESTRECDPLPFTARQGRRSTVTGTAQANGLEDLFRTAPHPRTVTPHLTANEESRDSDIFTAGQVIEEMVRLKDVAHRPVAQLGDLGIPEGSEVLSFDLDRAIVAAVETTDEVEKGRLA
jgi:hypothetical protein